MIAFVNLVEAQHSKNIIPSALADDWISKGQLIITDLDDTISTPLTPPSGNSNHDSSNIPNEKEINWLDPLSFSMPKNKNIQIFNPWIFRLIQRFPIFEYLF